MNSLIVNFNSTFCGQRNTTNQPKMCCPHFKLYYDGIVFNVLYLKNNYKIKYEIIQSKLEYSLIRKM